MQIGFIFSLLFAIMVTIFAIQNAQSVPIAFLGIKGEASLALVILIAAASGAIILALLGTFRWVKKGLKVKDFKNQLKQNEKELQTIKDENQDLINQLELFNKESNDTEKNTEVDLVQNVIDKTEEENNVEENTVKENALEDNESINNEQ